MGSGPAAITHEMPKPSKASRISFAWDVKYFIETGRSAIAMSVELPSSEAEDRQALDKDVRRYNDHQAKKRKTSKKLASEIETTIKAHGTAQARPVEEVAVRLVMTEQARAQDDRTVLDALTVTRRHARHSAEPENVIRSAVLTNAQPIASLRLISTEKEVAHENAKKRFVEETAKEAPAKKRLTLDSVAAAGVTTLEELIDDNTKYWKRRPKPGASSKLPLFRRDIVSSRHIAKVLFECYAPRQGRCANATLGLCRTQLEPSLRHPCKADAVCMNYLSPLQWEAFEQNEEVSVLAAPSDRLFVDPLCVFCYRYQVTREVAKDSVASNQSAITNEIAAYYHQVDIIGEYDKSACIQENSGNVSGILGPVVAYNAANFQPVVGIRASTENWTLEQVLSVQDFRTQKASFPPERVVYGWAETEAAFFRLNNNTVPTVAQLNPYETCITQIKDGPLSLRLLLRNYFQHRAKSSASGPSILAYDHLFIELRDAIEMTNLWNKPYPIFEISNIAKLEERKQLVDANAPVTQPFVRYHPWQYICMHKVTEAPPIASHRIYYAFLYLVNGIYHLKKTMASLPLTIKRKLKVYLKAFRPMQDYFREAGDLSDTAIRQRRLHCERLGATTSAYFATYPRPTKLCFVVSDYEYLELQTTTLGRAAPNEELNQLYANAEPPHSRELLQRAENFSDLFPALRLAQSGAYQEASDLYAELCTNMREPVQLHWPSNIIASFSAVVGPDEQADATELHRRVSLATHANALISSMETVFRELLLMLRNENAQYEALVKNLPLATAEFGEIVEWTKEMLAAHGNADGLLQRLGVTSFDRLLPIGFHTDGSGIDTQQWQENAYLLTALARVHILDRLRALEKPTEQRRRHLLLLMRNAHCDLVSVVVERGPYVAVRDDQWLLSHAALPTTISPWQSSTEYHPIMSQLAAIWPNPTRERHQGMLPNLGAAMLYVNFFSEFEAKQTFFLQELFKHRNNLRQCGHAHFRAVFSSDTLVYSLRKLNKLKQANKLKLKGTLKIQHRSDAIVTMRNFMLLLLEMSFKGLYEHCDVVPNFRCTMELNTLFNNADQPGVHERFDTLFATVVQNGEERLKFDKIINDVLMEFVSVQLRGNTAVRDVVREVYRVDLTARSLALMDVLRLVLDRENTLDLVRVVGVQHRVNLKLNHKIANRRKLGNIAAICCVIQESDARRYDSVYRKAASLTVEYQITAEQIWMVECFVQHLDPLGNLFAEELQYVGMTEETIKALSRIEELQSGRSVVDEEAIRIFGELEVRQASLVAYFFEYLQRYVRFRPITMTNQEFLQKQARALRKAAGSEEIPPALTTGVASLCCDRWDGFFPVKQYFWKSEDENKHKHYNTPLGNQSIRRDTVSDEILCGFQPNKPTKKKDPKKFRKLQRNIEIEAGLVPTDIDQEFITVRKQYLAAQRHTNTGEVPRLAKQRRLEGRIPDCARSRVLEMNLTGIVLQCPPLRLPKQKKKDAHKRVVDEKKSQDRNRLYPPSRAAAMSVSQPPYLIAPCCARIHGYALNNWSANGYYCGGCLPYSNNERAIANELLCASCLSVVPNRPAFNQCPDDKCPGRKAKKRSKCRHGAQPLLLYDDVHENRQAYQFLCDDCLLPFRATPAALLRLSAIKARSTAVVNKILLEQ